MECPRIALKRTQVSGPLRSGRGTARFVWALVTFPAMRCAKLGRNRGDCCILSKAGRPKRKSRLRGIIKTGDRPYNIGQSASKIPDVEGTGV